MCEWLCLNAFSIKRPVNDFGTPQICILWGLVLVFFFVYNINFVLISEMCSNLQHWLFGIPIQPLAVFLFRQIGADAALLPLL
jgi:hypothetical protein